MALKISNTPYPVANASISVGEREHRQKQTKKDDKKEEQKRELSLEEVRQLIEKLNQHPQYQQKGLQFKLVERKEAPLEIQLISEQDKLIQSLTPAQAFKMAENLDLAPKGGLVNVSG